MVRDLITTCQVVRAGWVAPDSVGSGVPPERPRRNECLVVFGINLKVPRSGRFYGQERAGGYQLDLKGMPRDFISQI